MLLDSLLRCLKPILGRGARRPIRRTTPLLVEQLEDRTVPSTIQGMVFNDLNANGLRDAGESGLAGWKVFLDRDRNEFISAGETSTLTDAAGNYSFDTTNETPAVWPSGAQAYVVGAVVEPGTGGRWLDTTATLAIVQLTEPAAVRNFGVRFQPFVGVAPAGSETLVNQTVAGQQTGASVAADANGNYVLAWKSIGTGGTDTIYARAFNANGTPRTGELLVGEVPSNSGGAMVAMSGDGLHFSVAWSRYEGTWSGAQVTSVLTRLYLNDGTPASGPIVVAQGSSQINASLRGIAMDGNGDFVVLYGRSNYVPPKGITVGYWKSPTLMLQRYTPGGAASGTAITVATPNLIGGQTRVSMDANGNFLVAWDDVQSSQKSGSIGYVYAQRYNANGQTNGTRITIASNTFADGSLNLSMNAAGRFAVTYGVANVGTLVQVYNSDATPAGGPVGLGGISAWWGAAAMDVAGNVTVVWYHSNGPTSSGASYPYGSEIHFERLTAAGVLEPVSIVNTTTEGAQFAPSIAATGNGSFVVAWQGYGPGDDAGIFAQRFSTAPHIGSFTASPNPVTAGSPVTLTAANVQALNPGSMITQVAFYVDSNNNGILEPGTDTLLGYGIQTSPGVWNFTFSTTGWTSGSHKLFAQALDSYGVFSDPLALNLDVAP